MPSLPVTGAGFLRKNGKRNSTSGTLCVEPFEQLGGDAGDRVHIEDRAVGVEHFDKTAHVSALAILRQIHGHGNGRDGALFRIRFVTNAQWIPEVFHPDPVDRQVWESV